MRRLGGNRPSIRRPLAELWVFAVRVAEAASPARAAPITRVRFAFAGSIFVRRLTPRRVISTGGVGLASLGRTLAGVCRSLAAGGEPLAGAGEGPAAAGECFARAPIGRIWFSAPALSSPPSALVPLLQAEPMLGRRYHPGAGPRVPVSLAGDRKGLSPLPVRIPWSSRPVI